VPPSFVHEMVDSILLVDIGWCGLGMGVLGFIGRLGLWLLGSASGAFYRVSVGRVFWNALLFLTNVARVSMPLFVGLLIVATQWQLLLAKPFATACSIVMPHLPD
jgi:hypothetical protein